MSHRIPSILHFALSGAAVLGLVGLMGCSSEQTYTPTTLVVPSQWTISLHDPADVYDAMDAAATATGLARDPGYSFKVNGTWTSQRVRCAPNGSERHTALCVFRFTVMPVPDFNAPQPPQVTLSVKVNVPQKVVYDPQLALQQIRIEATLDQITGKLSGRYFGDVKVSQTEPLTF